jgi:hypothetical protein
VDAIGAAERERRARERADLIRKATDALLAEITRRDEASEPPMLKDRDAVPFLKNYRLTRKLTREVIDNPEGRWVLAELEGVKGHPVALLTPRKKGDGGGNTPLTEGAKTLGENDADFRRAHEQGAAEIPPSQASLNWGSEGSRISAASASSLPPSEIKDEPPDEEKGSFPQPDEVDL